MNSKTSLFYVLLIKHNLWPMTYDLNSNLFSFRSLKWNRWTLTAALRSPHVKEKSSSEKFLVRSAEMMPTTTSITGPNVAIRAEHFFAGAQHRMQNTNAWPIISAKSIGPQGGTASHVVLLNVLVWE